MLIIQEPITFRENLTIRINHLIQDEKLARNIERGVYNYALKEATTRKLLKKWDNPYFVQLYIDRMRSIYTNIKNPQLCKSIQEGTIKTSELAYMTHQELLPEKWTILIEEKNKRDKNKYETTIEAATDTCICSKCHSNKCTYYQMQTRSADEPMTTFVTCIECGKRWKC